MAYLRQRLLLLLLVLKPIICDVNNLSGLPGQGYCLAINIGHPYQKFNVLIDTGSATLAVASLSSSKITPYFHAENSTTAVDTGFIINSRYTYSGWEAKLAMDYVQVPSQPHIPEVMTDIGLIISDKHFYFGSDQNWQGILGLGYPLLAATGDEVKSKTWLEALDRKRGRSTSFDIKLCGVDKQSKPFHYGRFRLLDESTPNTNNNTVFTTPIIRQWWYELGVLSIRVLKKVTLNATNYTDEVFEPNIDMCQSLNKERGLVIDSGTTNVRLPKELFNKIATELKEAAAVQKILLDDSYWDGKAVCMAENIDWNKSGLPYVGIDLVSHENHKEYFTIEIPPENYMHFMSEFKNGSHLVRCFKFGFELGDIAAGLGVVAFEGLQVTFDKTYDVIRFQESDCGPDIRISGPYATNTDIFKLCNLSKILPKHVSASSSIMSVKWACIIMLLVAFVFLCHLVKPPFRKWFLKWKGYMYSRAYF